MNAAAFTWQLSPDAIPGVAVVPLSDCHAPHTTETFGIFPSERKARNALVRFAAQTPSMPWLPVAGANRPGSSTKRGPAGRCPRSDSDAAGRHPRAFGSVDQSPQRRQLMGSVRRRFEAIAGLSAWPHRGVRSGIGSRALGYPRRRSSWQISRDGAYAWKRAACGLIFRKAAFLRAHFDRRLFLPYWAMSDSFLERLLPVRAGIGIHRESKWRRNAMPVARDILSGACVCAGVFRSAPRR